MARVFEDAHFSGLFRNEAGDPKDTEGFYYNWGATTPLESLVEGEYGVEPIPRGVKIYPRNCEINDGIYKSYRLIYSALSNGPKYFEELRKITNLHRNTLSSRLKFLVSEGLVRKVRKSNKVYYEIVHNRELEWLYLYL